MNFVIDYGIEDISKIVEEVISRIPSKSFVFLKGQMGAGKTTLTKEILKQLGVKQTVTSPTFTFVNEYQSDSNIFYHIFPFLLLLFCHFQILLYYILYR